MARLSPHLENAPLFQNRVSSACDVALLNEPQSLETYQDPFFGHAWRWTPQIGTAVYGKTADLPPTPIDELAHGFLRTPYRRIPVIGVESIQKLFDFHAKVRSMNPNIEGVWRGQNKLFPLPRDNVDRRRLYGEISAVEPSFLPSASRKGVRFAELFETWSGILDLYIESRVEWLARTYLSRAREIREQARAFRDGYNYRIWGFATAQHYGLPSVGLDVTNDIAVALFFALNTFEIDPASGATTITRAPDTDEPYIFLMGGFKNDLVNDEEIAPAWLQCARPKAQNAMFFSTGWGVAGNKAAERIVLAFRLINHRRWSLPKGADELFPRAANDTFVEFLLDARKRFAEPQVQELLRRIYFAA